jgi:hypothetical protein
MTYTDIRTTIHGVYCNGWDSRANIKKKTLFLRYEVGVVLPTYFLLPVSLAFPISPAFLPPIDELTTKGLRPDRGESRAHHPPAPVTVRPPAGIRHSHCRFRLAAIAEGGGNKLKPNPRLLSSVNCSVFQTKSKHFRSINGDSFLMSHLLKRINSRLFSDRLAYFLAGYSTFLRYFCAHCSLASFSSHSQNPPLFSDALVLAAAVFHHAIHGGLLLEPHRRRMRRAPV